MVSVSSSTSWKTSMLYIVKSVSHEKINFFLIMLLCFNSLELEYGLIFYGQFIKALTVSCCCSWVLWRSITSQVISIALYSEREKPDKFCSDALISAWGSFTCRKSTTWDLWLYFPSKGSHIPDFYALKKSIDPGRVWTPEPRIQCRVW